MYFFDEIIKLFQIMITIKIASIGYFMQFFAPKTIIQTLRTINFIILLFLRILEFNGIYRLIK